MPTDYSIAIGTYVIDEKDKVPIFSKEGYPICMFRPDKDMWSIELEGKTKYIVPHGWGQNIHYQYFKNLSSDDDLAKCKLDIFHEKLVIKDKNNQILKEFLPSYTNRFSEEMVEVRKLWERDETKMNILHYSKYLSGTIEEVLEPVALFSKNHEGVKYYGEEDQKPLVFS